MEVIQPTTPITGQKPGTSGLRKRTEVFMAPHYLENFVQSIFSAVGSSELEGSTILVSGDGRYFNKQAIQKICKMAAQSGISKVLIGKDGLISTPAASAVIREWKDEKVLFGMILSASHNPGGKSGDFGIKVNTKQGGPANEQLTDSIYEFSTHIKEYKYAQFEDFSLETVGVVEIAPKVALKVEIIDPIVHWMNIMKRTFNFEKIRNLMRRSDFSMVFDGLNGVGGIYAKKLFVELFGLPEDCLIGCEPMVDFGGSHPDPNLVYAHRLVEKMKVLNPESVDTTTPVFGAAVDGDADRNMIVGSGFFVSPGDSVAILAWYAQRCIPYFSEGLKGLARSMPTSAALDAVGAELGKKVFVTPTGWKYFVNLMDSGQISICGEESFGTGSDHIREKDGLWAVLAWLSVLAYRNEDGTKPLVTVKQIVEEFWQKFGRFYYCRYDYENVASEDATKVFAHLEKLVQDLEVLPRQDFIKQNSSIIRDSDESFSKAENFRYVDPVDGSVAANQGIQLTLESGSRIIFRLSGTGSSGATIRVYFDKHEKDVKLLNQPITDALGSISEFGLRISRIAELTRRDSPSVIT